MSALVRYLVVASALLVSALHAEHAPVAPLQGERAAEQKCELVDNHGQAKLAGGTLTPFWAQEYIGGELARNALAAFAKSGGTVEAPLVGVIDGGMHKDRILGPVTDSLKQAMAGGKLEGDNPNHGTNVCNILNGTAPVGVGIGKLEAFVPNRLGCEEAIEKMLATSVRLVSVSQRWDREKEQKGLSELTKQAIVCIAAGNSHPAPAPQFPGASGVIGVGSLSPSGFLSYFSQEGSGVTIMAPSDLLQTGHNGTFGRFGGTSGATPMVTGSLSNVLAVLPELTSAEAKVLLEKTAVPTVNSRQVPRLNGAGMLNALKLVQTAIRLKRRGWPTDRAKLLADPSTYDFSKTGPGEAHANIDDLLAGGKEALRSPNCARKREGFQKIQSAFLLAAGSPDAVSSAVFEEARQLLVRHFTEQGLTTNAAFYTSLGPAAGLASVLEAQTPKENEGGLRAIARTMQLLPAATRQASMERVLQSNDIPTAVNAVFMLRRWGGNTLPFVRLAYGHASPRVRIAALNQSRYAGPGWQAFIRSAMSDPDPGVAARATELAALPEK